MYYQSPESCVRSDVQGVSAQTQSHLLPTLWADVRSRCKKSIHCSSGVYKVVFVLDSVYHAQLWGALRSIVTSGPWSQPGNPLNEFLYSFGNFTIHTNKRFSQTSELVDWNSTKNTCPLPLQCERSRLGVYTRIFLCPGPWHRADCLGRQPEVVKTAKDGVLSIG